MMQMECVRSNVEQSAAVAVAQGITVVGRCLCRGRSAYRGVDENRTNDIAE